MFVLPGLSVNQLLLSMDKNKSTARGGGSSSNNNNRNKRVGAIGFALFGSVFGVLSLAALFGLFG